MPKPLSLDEIIENGGINGVTISEIEERSAPLSDALEDSTRYRVRSHVGFLDPNESLIQRLRIDNEKVALLGTTHQHLSGELERVLRLSSQLRAQLHKGPDGPIEFNFEYVPYKTESLVLPKAQKLVISHRSYAGAQSSLFKNLERNPLDASEEDILSWKEDYELLNTRFPVVELHVAGGVGTGICHYISHYGFYEGGSVNPYRIDPFVLHMVLSGIPSQGAKDALINHFSACKLKQIAEHNQSLSFHTNSNEEFIDEITEHLNLQHEKVIQELDDKIKQVKDISLGAQSISK